MNAKAPHVSTVVFVWTVSMATRAIVLLDGTAHIVKQVNIDSVI